MPVSDPGVATGDGVAFAEQLLTLIETAPVVTTYKYAVLLALLDAAIETADSSGTAPAAVSTELLALKILELYWPQTRPYAGAEGFVLRQGRSGQAEIITAISRFRSLLRNPTGSWSVARRERPEEFDQLLAGIELRLAENPLPRLSATPGWNVFKVDWASTVRKTAFRDEEFRREVDLTLAAQTHLLRLTGLLRPVLFRHWAVLIMSMNREHFEQGDLEAFLFGAERVALQRLRQPLAELQGGLCFYCSRKLGVDVDVDHFLPWSRYIDNGLENLVLAHHSCNVAKSAIMAAPKHLERWRQERAEENTYDIDLRQIADAHSWEYRPAVALKAARALYFSLPGGTKLWLREKELVDLVPVEIHTILRV